MEKSPFPSTTSFDIPSLISSTSKICNVKLSPDGMYVIYEVQPFYNIQEFPSSSEIWIAQTGGKSNARKLIGNGRLAVFHPDGSTIMFLNSMGRLCIIAGSGVPREVRQIPVSVHSFEISPNGKWIAFSTIATQSSIVRVFGMSSGSSNVELHLFCFATGEIRTVELSRTDRQIQQFSWSPDSSQLLIRWKDRVIGAETEGPVILESLFVDHSRPRYIIANYPRSPSSPSVWLSSNHIVDLQNFIPKNTLDALALFIHHPITDSKPRDFTDFSQRFYGTTEDAVRIVHLGYSSVAVEVCTGLETRIDVLTLSPGDDIECIPIFQTQDESIWSGEWDVKRVVDRFSGKVEYIFAGILSSVVRHEGPGVWCIQSRQAMTGEADGFVQVQHELRMRVSPLCHFQWLINAPTIAVATIRCKAKDGVMLNALVRGPPGYDFTFTLPTILVLHDGPYQRDVLDYMPYFCNWKEALAWAGFLVISVNYRGSQGIGHTFASSSSISGSWDDCETMLGEIIKKGWVDENNLGVGGWGHGGSLAAYALSSSGKYRFRAGVVGAGVSNWETMPLEGAYFEVDAAIGGWSAQKTSRMTSPIHILQRRGRKCICNTVSKQDTSVLILHGDKDERVPLGQATQLYRMLQQTDGYKVECVVYPGENHIFTRRDNAKDVVRRTINWFKAKMGTSDAI